MVNVLRKSCLIIMSAAAVLMAGCISYSPSFPVHTEKVKVTIPGMKDDVKIAFLSDLHITIPNDEVAPANTGIVSSRRSIFSNNGIFSQDQCREWMILLNNSGADYILFGGDLVDFASEANLKTLKEELGLLNTPYMYIRADHDTEPFYLIDEDKLKCEDLQRDICYFEDVFVTEYENFVIIGWNNSTSQLTADGLARIEDALFGGKKAILLTHVPIEPLDDKSLENKSRDSFSGQSLLWGYGDNAYTPDENTSKLIDMIYADDTPFVQILAGHMHFSWDGNVTPKVRQHVFGPSFGGNMGMIRISGK